MTRSTKAGRAVQPSSFRFRLRSLFFLTTACAVLSALYRYFGDTLLLPLLLGVVACWAVLLGASACCWAVTRVVDASLAMRDVLFGTPAARSVRDRQERENCDDGNVTIDRTVERLRKQEGLAAARYNAGRGPIEDVLRARAVRLVAEIEVLRGGAAKRRGPSSTRTAPIPS